MEENRSSYATGNMGTGSNAGVLQSQPELRPKSEHGEGVTARTLEEQTAKLPSDTWLWAALASMAVSAALQVSGKQRLSLFVGQWAPSFLLIGVYNKIVKVAGSH